MQIFAPDYYKDFSCIAGACRHTCCRGWEIDIDADTYEAYMNAEGALGEKLRKNMYTDEEGAHFTLDTEERCPFLNAENLCDIILEMGEDALCQICTDHPRYRNFFESRTEIGLGLSCESVCALILGQKKRPSIIPLTAEEDGEVPEMERLFFLLREEIMDLIFADESVETCMNNIRERYGITLPEKEKWTTVYENLTVLHAEWRRKLKRLSDAQSTLENDMAAKQLLTYFVFRHLADSFFDGRIKTGIAFCLHAVEVILCLSASDADFTETARQYSEEIEYAAENTEALFAFLENDT